MNLDEPRLTRTAPKGFRDNAEVQARRRLILRSYLTGLHAADQKWRFGTLVEQTAKRINEGSSREGVETLLTLIRDLAQDPATRAFYDGSLHKCTDSNFKKLGVIDTDAFVETGMKMIDENERTSNAEIAERESRRASCAAGRHHWVAAGLRHYFHSGHMYKTEVMQEKVCGWCGRKQ